MARTAEGGGEGIWEQQVQMPKDVMDHKTQKAVLWLGYGGGAGGVVQLSKL